MSTGIVAHGPEGVSAGKDHHGRNNIP
jgi:hypothetical protein